MGDDPELQRIEQQLRRSDRLRRKAQADLADYQRRHEFERVKGMHRAERKRWMKHRMRDLGLAAFLASFLNRALRWIEGHPGRAVVAAATAGTVVTVVALGPELRGQPPDVTVVPSRDDPTTSQQYRPEDATVRAEVEEASPTPENIGGGSATSPAATATSAPVAPEPEPEPTSVPPPPASTTPTVKPTVPQTPTPSPSSPHEGGGRHKLCLGLDARPVVNLGACVRELLGLRDGSQP